MNKQTDATTGASMAQSKQLAPQDHWPGPQGMIPVTSGRADDANVHARSYLDRLLVEMRLIDSVKPDLTTTIFGHQFQSPLTLAAVSHLDQVLDDPDRQPMEEKARSSKELGLLNWVGMETNEKFASIAQAGGDTIRIIKPFANHDKILDKIEFAEKQGAVAVGIDIDHVPGENGNYDVVDGNPMGPITYNDLKKYVNSTDLPFIAKGVLSVQDAEKAAAAGCQGIVISHHHGRVPFGVPPLLMLPKIKKALSGSDMTIFADGSLMTGFDAHKALALGADAVLIGRGILKELLDDGQSGATQKLKLMNQQLSRMMIYTGVKDTKSFDPSVLHLEK